MNKLHITNEYLFGQTLAIYDICINDLNLNISMPILGISRLTPSKLKYKI